MACGTWQGWEVLCSEIATPTAACSRQVVTRTGEVRLPCCFCSHAETLCRNAISYKTDALSSQPLHFSMS